MSRIYSPKVILVNPKITIGRNLIQISGTGRHISVITAARKAI
jgi:hypothetical protein